MTAADGRSLPGTVDRSAVVRVVRNSRGRRGWIGFLAVMAAAVVASQAQGACSRATIADIFQALDPVEYYIGSFARAKDRGVATHNSSSSVLGFSKRHRNGVSYLEATFDADFASRTDSTTLRIRDDGTAEIVLNAWGGATYPVDLVHCEFRLISDPPTVPTGNTPSNDRVLILGRYAEGNGVSGFTLALTAIDRAG